MYWLSISALGFIVYFYCQGRKKYGNSGGVIDDTSEKKNVSEKADESEVIDGSEADEDLKISKSSQPEYKLNEGKLNGESLELSKSLEGVSDPWERHLVYVKHIDPAYKNRHEDTQDYFLNMSRQYVSEFPKLKDVVFNRLGNTPKLISVFKQLAIFLEEQKEYDKAIEICEAALSHGLDDGTKTGYTGRIERLNEKKSIK